MTEPLYIIKDLTHKEGKRQVLTIRNLEIHRGIIYAITGPPGAGKSSLLEILANQVKPSPGMITFEDEDIRAASVKQTFKAEVFYLPQSSLKGRGLVKRHMLKNIKTASWSNEPVESRLDKVVRQMNLNEKLPRKLNSLSPGERRWIDLAICIASDARVLIIDELEQHMGYDELENLKRLLQRKCNYEGTTIILATLSPMTIRKMTGITVTLDHGKIAMIRSVREGAPVRGAGDRDRDRNRSRSNGRGRDNDRNRGGGRSKREPAKQSGAASQGDSRGGSRKPRRSGGDTTSRPPRRENSPTASTPQQDEPAKSEPRKEESPKPSSRSGRPARTPRKPRRESRPGKGPAAGNAATPTPPKVEQPKEVDGNVKMEPVVEAPPPVEVDGNRRVKEKKVVSPKSKKPGRRVGRGRGTARSAKKPRSGSAATPPTETDPSS